MSTKKKKEKNDNTLNVYSLHYVSRVQDRVSSGVIYHRGSEHFGL